MGTFGEVKWKWSFPCPSLPQRGRGAWSGERAAGLAEVTTHASKEYTLPLQVPPYLVNWSGGPWDWALELCWRSIPEFDAIVGELSQAALSVIPVDLVAPEVRGCWRKTKKPGNKQFYTN